LSQKPLSLSLRAHDIHQGLQVANVDRNSGLVGRELEATQVVGMAAALATAIKGLDVIKQAQHLKAVANDQLDIPTFAFEPVITLLLEVEYIRNVQRDAAGKIAQLYETVPEDFARLYATLDQAYMDRRPGEIELSLVRTIDELSMGPRLVTDLQIDPKTREEVMAVADAAEAVKLIKAHGSEIAYSPYFAYEHPEAVRDALENMDLGHVHEAFERVRKYQGAPISVDANGETLTGLVAAGLMAGPTVANPQGVLQSFAVAPYGLPSDLRTIQKPVLDKAMAIVAAVRTGQHFGGVTNLADPRLVLQALLQPNRVVARHSSTKRQYSVLWKMGIVRFVGQGDRLAIQLIDTDDNVRAVKVAIDLLSFGEAMRVKEPTVWPMEAPDARGRYRNPIQAIKPARSRRELPEKTIADLIESAMSRAPVV
jgi:hypothetical protein